MLNPVKILKLTLVLYCLWMQVLNCAVAQTEPLNTGQNFVYTSFEDKSGLMSFEDVLKAEFTKGNSTPNLGITDTTLWIKITPSLLNNSIANTDKNVNQPLLLTVWPPRLKDLKLYKIESEKVPDWKGKNPVTNKTPIFQEIQLQNTRESSSFISKYAKSNFFYIDSNSNNDFYIIRLKSNYALQAKIQINTKAQNISNLLNQEFILGGIILGLVPLTLILLILSVNYRSNIYSSYFLTLSSTLVLYLMIQGFDIARIFYLRDISLEDQMRQLSIINALCSLLFMSYGIEHLEIMVNRMPFMRKVLITVFGIEIFLSLFNSSVILKMLGIEVIACSGLYIVLILRFAKFKNNSHRLVSLTFLTMNILGILAVLNLMGFPLTEIIDNQSFQLSRLLLVPFIFGIILWVLEKQNNQKLFFINNEKEIQEKINKEEIQRTELYENFITMLVHEIKTPLSTIQIATSSLKRHLDPNSPEQNRIDHIKISTEEINQIFNKCLQVIDVENKTIAIDPLAFSLKILIEDIQRTVNNDKVEFNTKFDGEITTDYFILRTIILNLISNAVKYSKKGTLIQFTTETNTQIDEQGKSLIFKVTNKIGDVGTPDTSKIFSRYYRSESAKQFTGSGLGLWLSQQLAYYIDSKISMLSISEEISFQLELSIN